MKSGQSLKHSLLRASTVACFLALATPATQAAPTLAVDLSNTTITSGVIDGVTFAFDNSQPTGSGVINSFLRIQKNKEEQGYNTNAAKVFDNVGGGFTHDVLFSSLQLINGNYLFLLDINENSGSGNLLSLDGLKFYATNTTSLSTTATDGNGDWDGSGATLLWSMDTLADNYVLLDYDRGTGGSGQGDMLLTVPESKLAGGAGFTNFILWSRFGLQEGSDANSDAGYEEWARITVPTTSSSTGSTGGGGGSGNIPEPGTLSLAGAAILGGFFYARRRRQAQA